MSLNLPKANAAACPQSSEADVRGSGGIRVLDPGCVKTVSGEIRKYNSPAWYRIKFAQPTGPIRNSSSTRSIAAKQQGRARSLLSRSGAVARPVSRAQLRPSMRIGAEKDDLWSNRAGGYVLHRELRHH